MAKYVLIYDTGDMLFDTQKEAFKFATYLRKKGHKIDRLQVHRSWTKKYKTNPKIIREWKR